MGQFANGRLRALEFGVEPLLELRHGHLRSMAVVKVCEGEGKFRAKFLQRHFRFAGLCQDEVGRFQDGGQIIHQRARPIENDIANHPGSLAARRAKRTQINSPFCHCNPS